MDAPRRRRRKKRREQEEKVEEEEKGYQYQGFDRISSLPNELAQHILSFLPEEDVARTSALSKRWKSIWRTLPGVDYNENRFQHLNDLQCRQEFLYSLSRLFLNKDLDRLLIQKIRVFAIHPHATGLELLLSLLIELSISNSKLLQLEIAVDSNNSYTYEDSEKIACSLPDRVFTAGTYLTSLCLKSCSCGPCENVKFPCLKTISLTFVLILDEMLKNLITNSPNLEDLSLLYCFQMMVLRVLNSNLKRLSVGSRSHLTLLEMDVPNLNLFNYHGILSIHHPSVEEHTVESSKIMEFSSPNRFGLESPKTLIMAHVRMDDTTLRSMLSSFRFLETAKLYCCTFGVVPFIVNPRLETLEMENYRQSKLILNSETLQSVKMTNHIVHTIFHGLIGMQFNSLKALELVGNIYFEFGIFNLNSGPCLETVIVRSCFLLRDFRLSSHSVNSLTVQSCFNLEEIALNTLNLQSFTYSGFMCDLSVLIIPDDVSVDLYLIKQPDHENFVEAYYKLMLWNFYRMFKYTRTITIKSDEFETIIVPRTLELGPAICFLEKFIVKTSLPDEMTYLNFLLEVMGHAFCFETVIIDVFTIHIELKFRVPPNIAELTSDRTQELAQTHDCIMQHLLEVEIANFAGNAYDMELVQYLLGHAMNLMNLTIGFRGYLPPCVLSSATMTSLSLPRANPFVVIGFKHC